MRRRPGVLLAALAALALAAPAAALGDVRIKGVDASGYPTVRLSVVASSPLSPAPSLEEDGTPVAGLEAENLGRRKSVVLALDRSRSMAGGSLAEASAAARAFVAAKPGADRIAVVGFGRKAVLLTTFSSATIDADSVLHTVEVDGKQGTALYDAVDLAARSLAAEANAGRVIILLTDGHDVSSHVSLAGAIRAATRAHAAVYPIAIAGEGFSPAPLQRLARATGGTYYPAASASALRGVYASIARELSRTWRLSYQTTARPGQTVRLEAAIRGAGSARLDVELSGDASAAVSKPSSLLPGAAYTSALGTLVLTLVVALLVLLAAGLALAGRRGAWIRSRLESHTVQAQSAKLAGERERLALVRGLFGATEEAFGHLRHWKAVHRLRERADLPLRTVEFLYVTAGASLLFGLISAVAGSSTLVILLAFLVGASIPLGFLWFKASRRVKAIEDSLPDLLITLAASLKAGHSFRQGVQNVVEEGHGPAAKEFKRVLTETRLGRPMDDALGEMAERVGSKNLEFVITAVTIQRQVGGSLAGLFDMVAEAVRNRQQFARKIKSLTAMGRMSAYVLVGLPFFMAGMLTVINPTYMAPLYHTSLGHKLILGGLVMMTIGGLLLKRIVSFKG